jgi:hypothetical protein
VRPVFGPQNGAAAGCQYPGVIPGQIINDHRFDVPEPLFAFALEEFTDGTTQSLFDHLVGVSKRNPQPAGELAPDGRFSRARETYQADHAELVVSEILGATQIFLVKTRSGGPLGKGKNPAALALVAQ